MRKYPSYCYVSKSCVFVELDYEIEVGNDLKMLVLPKYFTSSIVSTTNTSLLSSFVAFLTCFIVQGLAGPRLSHS